MAIDFTLTPELEQIRSEVRSFISDVVKPEEARIDGTDDGEGLEGSDRIEALIALREKAFAEGRWLLHMPVDWGGMGLGHVELAMV